MKRHIVIPARFASSRLPGKPLLTIHGREMVLRVADQAMQVTGVDSVCIATDHQDIASVCTHAGFEVVMTDKAHPSGTDRLQQVARLRAWHADDIVVNVQGDEPLIPASIIQQIMNLLEQHADCDMATLYDPIEDAAQFISPNSVKVVVSAQQQAIYFSRAPIPWDRDEFSWQTPQLSIQAKRHLGIYAYRVGLLHRYVAWPVGVLEQIEKLEQLRLLENGAKIAIDKACELLPAGVDTAQDLERLQQLESGCFAPIYRGA